MDFLSEGRINYRELQRIAKNMKLPGNLKYDLLVEVIRARKEGKEEVVERILSEQKLERYRRRNDKLMAQESAYQHLHMVPPVRPGAPNVTVSHPVHPPISDTQQCPSNRPYHCATFVNPRLSVPTTSHMNHVQFPRLVDFHQSSYCPDIRTILQMPPDVFESFYKRDQEELYQRIQENHRRNPSMSYQEWVKMMEEKKLATSTPQKQENFQSSSAPSVHSSFQLLVGTDVTVYEDRKKSFQMKDILNDHGSPSNYVQFNVNQFETNLPPISEMNLVQEQYFPPAESSSAVGGCPTASIAPPTSAVPCWRGVYEIPAESQFTQVNFTDESGIQQDLSGSSSEVSPSSSCETLRGGGGEEGGLVSLAAGGGGVLPKEELNSLRSDCPLPSPVLPPPQHILGPDILSRGASLTGDTFISTTKEDDLNSIYNSVIIVDSQDYTSQQ